MKSVIGTRHAGEEASPKCEAFNPQLESWRERMESALAARLPGPDAVPSRLHQAKRYSVLGGGKRVRPALLFATARSVGLTEVDAAACAVELVELRLHGDNAHCC